MSDLLKDLNDRQKEAVTAPMGPVLVLAGAGSGKTRVLTYRIAHLIEQGLASPENILALTFTNKAAGEMKQRINALLGIQNTEYRIQGRNSEFGIRNSMTMGTFHSVCVRILRQDIEKLGLGYGRNFVIFDEDDRGRLLKQITLELGLEERYKYQVFGYYISQAKNRLVVPEKLYLDNPDLMESLIAVYEEYTARMRSQNAVDFDDLLMLVCKLFGDSKITPPNLPLHKGRSFPSYVRGGEGELLKKYQNKFKYILVDEYQDTNHAQYFMLKKLVGREKNIFVVGDDAQSIYGFRGANMQNILGFKKDYPKARVIMLEQNYRSTQHILNTAHAVIKLNPFQYEKKLWTENTGGEKVSLYEALDEIDEAQFVLRQIGNFQFSMTNFQSNPNDQNPNDQITYTPIFDSFEEKLKRGFHRSNIPYSLPRRQAGTFNIPDNLREQVILYRTHAQSRAFEEELLSYGIPYHIVGGVKFYERQEIKDTLSFLRLLINPKDLVSFSRIINLPARGIGPKSFREIKNNFEKYKHSFARMERNMESFELSPKAAEGARDFFRLFEKAADLPEDKTLPDLMEFLLIGSGYKEFWLAKGEEGEIRWENIEELFNVAAKYRGVSWKEGVPAFLEEAALMTDLDSLDETGNSLTLMTLHSAKGLEYDRVFFVGLEEGLLPHQRSLMNGEELAEEIRLAYVGITRARKDLFLSYARQRQHYGEIRRSVPSRIIKAIPEKLLQRLNSK